MALRDVGEEVGSHAALRHRIEQPDVDEGLRKRHLGLCVYGAGEPHGVGDQRQSRAAAMEAGLQPREGRFGGCIELAVVVLRPSERTCGEPDEPDHEDEFGEATEALERQREDSEQHGEGHRARREELPAEQVDGAGERERKEQQRGRGERDVERAGAAVAEVERRDDDAGERGEERDELAVGGPGGEGPCEEEEAVADSIGPWRGRECPLVGGIDGAHARSSQRGEDGGG